MWNLYTKPNNDVIDMKEFIITVIACNIVFVSMLFIISNMFPKSSLYDTSVNHNEIVGIVDSILDVRIGCGVYVPADSLYYESYK